ncbi:MAG: hypothetical protein ACRCV9_11660 [Burkholderiaceae bacterium]
MAKLLFRFVRHGLLCLAAVLPGFTLAQTCAIPGRDGPATVSGVVNTYYQPPAGLLGGGTTSIANIGTLRAGGGAAVAAGDLLLIIQMQGATFNSSNNNCYGDGAGPCTDTLTRGAGSDPARGFTGAPTAGRHEFVRVVSAAGSAVTLASPLVNSYTNAAAGAQGQQTYQIIRVPQYSSLSLNSATPITPLAWNGATGGVVAVDVAGTTTFSGGGTHINASALGFRGGYGERGGVFNGDTAYAFNADAVTGARDTTKAEGVAGTPREVWNGTARVTVTAGQGYPGGDYGRGAPANAGGSGVGHNSGGGGGGNGGIGGPGGATWTGDTGGSRDVGGFGGAAYPASANQLVMGGGGGAGDANGGGAELSPTEGPGGVGGGMIFFFTGNTAGTGRLAANGGNALPADADASGGGGAGGSIRVFAAAGAGNIIATANGGNAGVFTLNGGANTGHCGSSGGGGGGGVILSNAGLGAGSTANGGTVPPHPDGGLCDGDSGAGGVNSTTAGSSPGATPGASCLPNLTVTKFTSNQNISAVTGASATYTIVVENAANAGAAQNVEIIDRQLPPLWALTGAPTYTYLPAPPPTGGNFASGAETTVNSAAYALRAVGAAPGNVPAGGSNANLNWNTFFVAPGGTVAVTYSVSISDSASVGIYHNDAGVTYLDPTRSAAGRKIAPAINNTANRPGTAYNTNTTYQTGQFAGQNVVGSHYSGLEGGLSPENVRLQPDLSITKARTGSGTLQVGAADSYTLVARNNGRAIANLTYAANQATAATNGGAGTILTGGTVVVTDTIPSGLTIGTITPPANWGCTTAGQLVTCTYTPPSLPIAAQTDLGIITIPVTATGAACPGPTSNIANIGSTTAAYGESDTANNASTAVAIPLGCIAAVSVTKTDGRTTVAQGNTVSYTIALNNAGPAAANGTLLADIPSAGLTGCTVTACTASGAAACPAAAAWPSLLTVGGVAISTLPSGGGVNFSVSCNVPATGL